MHVVWEEMVNSGRHCPQATQGQGCHAAGMMHPMEFVRVTSTQAAKIFNLYPRKGVIEEGSDADVILFDPRKEHVIRAAHQQSTMDTNIYEGKKIRGEVC